MSALADVAVEQVAPVNALLNTSAAAVSRVAFCYAVAQRSANVQQRARNEYLLFAAENGVIRDRHAFSFNSAECATLHYTQFEGSTTARIRTSTLG